MSELLSYANPDEYVVLNKTIVSCLAYLGIQDMPQYNYQYTGKKYAEVCAIAKKISAALKEAGDEDSDLLEVDYFLWDEVLPLVEKHEPVSQTQVSDKPKTQIDSKSLHDEIKEKLVAIGELLGFEARSERQERKLMWCGKLRSVIWGRPFMFLRFSPKVPLTV